MGPNATSLLAAIAMILVVMAVAFRLAGRREGCETYWRSWCLANILIAGAVVVFIFDLEFNIFIFRIAFGKLL